MKKWKYFLGASILGAGLLLKAGSPAAPILLGLVIAGFVTWKKSDKPTTPLPR